MNFTTAKSKKASYFFFNINKGDKHCPFLGLFWSLDPTTYLKILTSNLKFKSRLDSNEQTASQGPFELAE